MNYFIYLGLLIDENGPHFNVNHTISYLYTMYNGRCQFYHFKEHIEPKTYLEFDVPKNESFFVMALPKGWEVFMINQQWLFSSPSSITICSDMLLDISR